MEKFIRRIRIHDGREFEVCLNIDVDAIARHLTPRASRSKAKRSVFMAGNVELLIVQQLSATRAA